MLRLSTFIVCLLGASLTLGCRKSAEPEQKALCSAPCPKPGPSKEVLRFPDVWKDFCNGPRSIPFEIFGGRQFVRVDGGRVLGQGSAIKAGGEKRADRGHGGTCIWWRTGPKPGLRDSAGGGRVEDATECR